jgi:predicted transposase YbfD/YdcC
LSARYGTGHPRPKGRLRARYQEQPRPALHGRQGAARWRPKAVAVEPAKYQGARPRRAPPSHRRRRPQLAQQYDFPGIIAVGRIDSWRADTGKPATHKVRYFLASRLLSAKELLAVVRAHWGIENNLHWVLDVLFDEDACRSRKDHAPENLAVIRKLAINILQTVTGPRRISHKMLQARWNNDFLLTALAHMR